MAPPNVVRVKKVIFIVLSAEAKNRNKNDLHPVFYTSLLF